VAGARALGPRTAIPGTPLSVRPPKRWIPDPRQPGAFVLPVRRLVRGQEQWEADRRIRFTYRRLPAFQPPEMLLTMNQPAPLPVEPARIGPYPAAQVRRVMQRRFGQDLLVVESLLRLACLPTAR